MSQLLFLFLSGFLAALLNWKLERKSKHISIGSDKPQKSSSAPDSSSIRWSQSQPMFADGSADSNSNPIHMQGPGVLQYSPAVGEKSPLEEADEDPLLHVYSLLPALTGYFPDPGSLLWLAKSWYAGIICLLAAKPLLSAGTTSLKP